MTQDPNRPRPHVVNNDEKPRDQGRAKNPSSQTWQTVRTVALTTLVGAAVLGSASLLWKTATKHARRVLRREKPPEIEASPYAQPPPYPPGYPPPPPPYGYGHPYPAWPQSNVRDVPEALRDGPNFRPTAQPYMPPPAANPPQVVVAPSPEVIAEIRRLGAHVDKRFAAVEQRIDAMDNPDDDDLVDDDDEEEAPRRRN